MTFHFTETAEQSPTWNTQTDGRTDMFLPIMHLLNNKVGNSDIFLPRHLTGTLMNWNFKDSGKNVGPLLKIIYIKSK
jgi:hypothetical protein